MAGRNFLFVPGPTNVPDRVLRAMVVPMEDHRSPIFPELTRTLLTGLKPVFKTTTGTPILFPSSGTGCWEAALTNCLNPGDKVLASRFGQFSHLWVDMCQRLGFEVEILETPWGEGAPVERYLASLAADKQHRIKAVLVCQNETATGVTSDVAAVRKAMDSVKHPALLFVDTVSALVSIDFRMDEWGVDVCVSGSQKGLMLPTGMAFTGISAKAIAATAEAKTPRVYWDWRRLMGEASQAYWNGTAPVHFFYGLQEALRMLEEEGLDNVFARHHRLAEATRRAVRVWRQNDGPEIFAVDPGAQSDSITAVLVPEGYDADKIRQAALDKFNVSLGGGLDRLKGRVFRIGHLGDLNEPMVLGAIAAVEMALDLTGVPHGRGAVQAAMEYLAGEV